MVNLTKIHNFRNSGTNMFSIGLDGCITRDRSRFAELVEASMPAVRHFEGLQPESRVAAILIPHLIASSLAPTTCYSYKLHYSKFYIWCQGNNRTAMPLEEVSICI